MKHLCAVAVFLSIFALPAHGYTSDAAVLAPVHHFIDSVNDGDMKAADAAYASGAVIVDDLPPYLFQGNDAFGQWIAGLEARVKKAGVTGPVFTLMKPGSTKVTGDRAYAVIPAQVGFKQKGHLVGAETGTFTFVMSRAASGLRISAWTWSRSGSGS
jgi:hypothetical protein